MDSSPVDSSPLLGQASSHPINPVSASGHPVNPSYNTMSDTKQPLVADVKVSESSAAVVTPSSSDSSVPSSSTMNPVELVYEGDGFTLTNRRKDQLHAKVSRSTFILTSSSSRFSLSLSFDDILSASLPDSHTLRLHCYPHIEGGGCCSESTLRSHKQYDIHHDDEASLKRLWVKTNVALLGVPSSDEEKESEESIEKKLPQNQKKIMVLINPAAGSGKAEKMFQSVEPIFHHSFRRYDVLTTSQAQHGYEVAKELDLSVYDTIVTVSGDGLLNEALNGIMHREDWQTAIQTVTLGTLGGGSGNGLAMTMCTLSQEVYSPLHCAFLLLKGYRRRFDLCSCAQEGEKPSFGFLSVNWGETSDVDLESEKWRCCGGARFTFAAVAIIMKANKYRGDVSFIPAPVAHKPVGKDPSHTLPDHPICTTAVTCPSCVESSLTSHSVSTQLQALASYLRKTYDGESSGAEAKANEPVKNFSVDLETDGEKEQWQTLTDDFNFVFLMNVARAATDIHMAPYAHLSDGYMDLIYMARSGFCSLLPVFLDFEGGKHIHSKACKYLKVKALRIVPHADTKRSDLVLDGERMKYKPVEVRCWRGVGVLPCK